MQTPEPIRRFPGYECPDCARPFIFRQSYRRHWDDIHATGLYAHQPLMVYRPGTFTPLHEEPVLASPEIFSEVDRKEAAARLDTYLAATGHDPAWDTQQRLFGKDT